MAEDFSDLKPESSLVKLIILLACWPNRLLDWKIEGLILNTAYLHVHIYFWERSKNFKPMFYDPFEFWAF